MKLLIKRARMTAIIIASTYSRTTDFSDFTLLTTPTAPKQNDYDKKIYNQTIISVERRYSKVTPISRQPRIHQTNNNQRFLKNMLERAVTLHNEPLFTKTATYSTKAIQFFFAAIP